MKYLLLLLLFSCAPRIQEIEDQRLAHRCYMKNCPLRGYIYFYTEYPEGSDGYLYDLTHWCYPKWTPEQIEDYMWSTYEYGY